MELHSITYPLFLKQKKTESFRKVLEMKYSIDTGTSYLIAAGFLSVILNGIIGDNLKGTVDFFLMKLEISNTWLMEKRYLRKT